jgi:membrane protein YqaA with SNARE-associated domain
MTPLARRPFARLEEIAAGRSGLMLVGSWAFAEAIVLPIAPDVVLGLLALVAPRQVPRLFLALIAGALLGTAILYVLAAVAPDAVASMLLALPGITPDSLVAARAQVAGGDPVSIALVGPGTPLKVYTWAWATGPATPLALAAGVVLNRITRVAPGVIALAVVGLVAPGFLRRHQRLVLALYALFYVVVYAVYWR